MNDIQLLREVDHINDGVNSLIGKIEEQEVMIEELERRLDEATERCDDLNDTIKELRSILETPIDEM